MADYHIFRCAVQQREGDELQIRDLKCQNIAEVHMFLKRLYSVGNIADLSFLEIHQQLPEGRIALIHESRKPWPKVPTKKMDGIYCPKVPKGDSRVVSAKTKEEVDEVVKELAATATTVVGGVSLPDEQHRPVFPYKSEVA